MSWSSHTVQELSEMKEETGKDVNRQLSRTYRNITINKIKGLFLKDRKDVAHRGRSFNGKCVRHAHRKMCWVKDKNTVIFVVCFFVFVEEAENRVRVVKIQKNQLISYGLMAKFDIVRNNLIRNIPKLN